MKIPSVSKLASKMQTALYRFPFVFAVLIIAFLTLVNLFEISSSREEFWTKILLGCAIAFPLLIELQLVAEAKGRIPNWIKHILSISIICLSALACLLLPKFSDFTASVAVPLTLMITLFYSLLFYAPYIGSKSSADIWVFANRMIRNIIVSAFISGILYAGIALAVLAVDQLFSLVLSSNTWSNLMYHLACVIFVLVNFSVFLSRIPSKLIASANEFSVPHTVNIILKYVFIVLMGIYMLIFYASSFWIIARWELPVGWVSYLILTLGAVGVFVIWLSYPLIRKGEEKFWSKFEKIYLFSSAPLLIMLFVAIGRRISDYGITPPRYFVLVLALWLVGFTAYFLLSKKKNCIWIPLSVSVLLLISAVGPLSAYAVSKRSQVHLLESILTENKVLINGKIAKKIPSVTNSVAVQVNSILDELEDYDKSLYYLADRWSLKLSTKEESVSRYTIANSLHFATSGTEDYVMENYSYSTTYEYPDFHQVKGYDYFVDNRALYCWEDNGITLSLEGKEYVVSLSDDKTTFCLSEGKRPPVKLTANKYISLLKKKGYVFAKSGIDKTKDTANLEFIVNYGKRQFRFMVDSVDFEIKPNKPATFNKISFSILVK